MKDAYSRVPYHLTQSTDNSKENYSMNLNTENPRRPPRPASKDRLPYSSKIDTESGQMSKSHGIGAFPDTELTYDTYKHNMEEDKISLMRKLNSVLTNLDKASAEKAEIEEELQAKVQKVMELEAKISEEEQQKNTYNQNIQEDLQYERDLGSKLSKDLKKYEHEKDMLKDKLKEQEMFRQQLSNDTTKLNNEYHKKTKELKGLEQDYKHKKLQLGELERELESLRNYQKFSKEEKSRLEDEIERLSIEKKRLLTSMKREKNMMKEDSDAQFKSLATKLLVLKFARLREIQVGKALKQLKVYKNLSKCKQKAAKRLGTFIVGKEQNRQREYLKRWYMWSFDFVNHNKTINELADKKATLRCTSKFFFQWRSAYFDSLRKYDNKLEAITMIKNIIRAKDELKVRTAISTWKQRVNTFQTTKALVKRISRRKSTQTKKEAMLTWLYVLRKTKEKEKYEALRTHLTGLKIKQKIFYAWKLVQQEERAQNDIQKFFEWRDIVNQAKKEKFIKRSTYLVDITTQQDNRYLMVKTLNALKYNCYHEKFTKASEQLEYEITKKEDCEARLEQLQQINEEKIKYQCFRKAFSKYHDVTYVALQRWRDYSRYKVNILHRISDQLTGLHKLRLNDSFQIWKGYTSQHKINELVKTNEEITSDNTLVAQDIKKLDQQHATLKQLGVHVKEMKRLQRNSLKKWKNLVEYLDQKEYGFNILLKQEKRHKQIRAIKAWRQHIKEQKRLKYLQNFLENNDKYKTISLKTKIFEAFSLYAKSQKKAKVHVKRAVTRWQRNLEYGALRKWKDIVYRTRLETLKGQIMKLHNEHQQNTKEIHETNEKIESTLAYNSHLSERLLTQAKRVMCNTFARCLNGRMANCFNTWKRTLVNAQEREQALKNCTNYWKKKQQWVSFRKWATVTYERRRLEIGQKIDMQLIENNKLKEDIEREEVEYTKTVQDVQTEIANLEQQRDKHKRLYNNAVNALKSRFENNIIVDKRRTILTTWLSHVKQEKSAISTLFKIYSKNIKIRTFSTLRAHTYHCRKSAHLKASLTRLTHILQSSHLRKAFSCWRVTNYNTVTVSMFKAIKSFEESKLTHQRELNNLGKQKVIKAQRIMDLRKKGKILTRWFFVTRFQAVCNKKHTILQKKLTDNGKRKALEKWKDRKDATKLLRRNYERIRVKSNKKLMEKAIEGWKDHNLVQKTLVKGLCRMVKTYEDLDKSYGFNQIRHFGEARQARKQERKYHAAADLAYILNLYYKNRLSDTMNTLKVVSFKNQQDKNLCRRVFLHALLGKLRSSFDLWKHNCTKMRLAYEINTEGDVAVEAHRAKRRVDILKKFLSQHGHPKKEIEEELTQRRNTQTLNMKSFIIRCFFKGSEFNVIPKAFNQLKAWTRTRKLYREACSLTLKYLRSDIFWAFKRWKHHHEDERKKLSVLSKHELVRKCVDDEHLLSTLQLQEQDKHEHINLQMAERDQLLTHFASGQKIAFNRCEYKLKWKPLRRAFLRWQKYAYDLKISETDSQISKTQSIIEELMKVCQKAEDKNKDLIQENEELRQASLDGIEIAKAVQELTKEREKLSSDLCDKNQAIQQLLDDNNTMSQKLNQF